MVDNSKSIEDICFMGTEETKSIDTTPKAQEIVANMDLPQNGDYDNCMA